MEIDQCGKGALNPCLWNHCSHFGCGLLQPPRWSPSSHQCGNSPSFSLKFCNKGLSVSAQMGILPPSHFTFPALFFLSTLLPKIESPFFKSLCRNLQGERTGSLELPVIITPWSNFSTGYEVDKGFRRMLRVSLREQRGFSFRGIVGEEPIARQGISADSVDSEDTIGRACASPATHEPPSWVLCSPEVSSWWDISFLSTFFFEGGEMFPKGSTPLTPLCLVELSPSFKVLFKSRLLWEAFLDDFS